MKTSNASWWDWPERCFEMPFWKGRIEISLLIKILRLFFKLKIWSTVLFSNVKNFDKNLLPSHLIKHTHTHTHTYPGKCLPSSRNNLLHKMQWIWEKCETAYIHMSHQHTWNLSTFLLLFDICAKWLFLRSSHMSPNMCLPVSLWQVNRCGRLD